MPICGRSCHSIYLPVTEISACKISNMTGDEKPYGCDLDDITKEEIKDAQCMHGLSLPLMMLKKTTRCSKR